MSLKNIALIVVLWRILSQASGFGVIVEDRVPTFVMYVEKDFSRGPIL